MGSTGPSEPHPWTARRVRASGASILLALVTVVAVLLAQDLFRAATQPLGWVAAAASLALVLSPVIAVQARWMPRGLAIVTTLLVGLVGLASVGAGLFFEVQDQLGELGERLPVAAAELQEDSGEGSLVARLELGALVEDLVDQATERIAPTATIGDAVGTVPAFFVSGILVIFFLIWGGAMVEGLERQIGDPRRRERLTRGVALVARLTQRYVVGAVVIAVAVAVVGGVVAWAVGLQTPLVLGVVLGAASVLPTIGVLFGGVPLLLLSAASDPMPTTVVLAVGLVVLQVVVAVVTRRVLEQRTFHVGPAVVVVAVLVGSDLYGIGGAFVALLVGILAVAAIEAWEREQGLDEVPIRSAPEATPG